MPKVYFALVFFPFPLILGNILQIRFYGLSIVWVCAAISMLILFIDTMEDALIKDELTGLYNHRQVNVQLTWEAQHLRSARQPLVAAMLDVDHFKQINDSFGHLAGDEALRIVGKTLRDSSRQSDFIGRFGGDEFVFVGHMQDAAEAQAFLKTLKQALAAAAERRKLPYSLTLSAGYTLCAPGQKTSADDMIRAADREMYREKKTKFCAG